MKSPARALCALGPVVVVGGLSWYHSQFVADPPYDFIGSFRLPWALLFVAMLWLAVYATGLPDERRTTRGIWAAAVLSPLVAALGISVVQLLVGSALLPRFVVLSSALILIPWNVLCARLAEDGDAFARGSTRVVVLGDLADAGSLWADLTGRTERPASIVAMMTIEEAAPDRRAAPLLEVVAEQRANLIVLDNVAQTNARVVRQAARAHMAGVRVRSLTGFYEEWLGKLPISELERVSMMFDIAELHGGAYVRLKRLLDIVIGLGATALLALSIPLVWVGDLIANRGPLFFRQERVGKDGETFTILKYRTMVDEPEREATWTSRDDPRVTTFGAFLRRTHMDELPQAVNILRGDLSVVGLVPNSRGMSRS